MTRYIDADACIDYIRNNNQHAWEALAYAPTIDAVEVVRCKDCKKAETEDCSHSYWDDDWGMWRVGYNGDDWYCADGERKTE